MRILVIFVASVAKVAFAVAAEPPLPMGWVSLAELAVNSKGVLVATLLSIDSEDPGPPNTRDFDSHWKVVQTLRGSYPQEAKMNFFAQTFPEEHRERKPTVGQKYILICSASNATQIACVLEYSESKLQEVRKMFGAETK